MMQTLRATITMLQHLQVKVKDVEIVEVSLARMTRGYHTLRFRFIFNEGKTQGHEILVTDCFAMDNEYLVDRIINEMNLLREK